jgi:WD40 repeat protein
MVMLWDVAGRREVGALRHRSGVKDVAFSPGGQLLAIACRDHTVRLWDLPSRQELFTLTGHAGIVDAVAFSPDGRTLATSGSDRLVKLWNVATRQAVGVLRGHQASVLHVAFSPDGGLLASGSMDATVRLWRAEALAEATPPPAARLSDSSKMNGRDTARAATRRPEPRRRSDRSHRAWPLR